MKKFEGQEKWGVPRFSRNTSDKLKETDEFYGEKGILCKTQGK